MDASHTGLAGNHHGVRDSANLLPYQSLTCVSTIAADSLKGSIFGHKPGLFVLFFTEMWERFSYYGMRVLFVVFLLEEAFNGDVWNRADAAALYGIYTGFVYFTPMLGGIVADKFLGYRRAVLLGAFIMTVGHGLLAFETEYFWYTGLLCLIVGNGFFKPNISSIVGQLYAGEAQRKDGAYTIFYMGINAGAFLGILLCSYYGENAAYGYGYGFGLAGIFMLIGMIQFYFGQGIFGNIGLPPSDPNFVMLSDEDSAPAAGEDTAVAKHYEDEVADVKEVTTTGGSSRVIKWGAIGLFLGAVLYALLVTFGDPMDNALQTFSNYIMPPIVVGAVVAFIGWIVTDPSLGTVERDRVWVIVILSAFIVFFWWAFEQAGSSMTVFALDYTDRTLEGTGKTLFNIANTILSVVPIIVLTYVLAKLFGITFQRFTTANLVLGTAFVIIWLLVILMLSEQFSDQDPEIPAGWFQIFNSLFIICFAPLFSRLWDRRVAWLKSWMSKFALGLTLLGIGFAILSIGALSIPDGAKTAQVSIFWLIVAYLFHTLGELCISPVGLSYVSKLSPGRLVGLMFGVFFVANFIANFAGGLTASKIEPIAEQIGLSGFFLIFAIVPITAAAILLLIRGNMRKMMHGIE